MWHVKYEAIFNLKHSNLNYNLYNFMYFPPIGKNAISCILPVIIDFYVSKNKNPSAGFQVLVLPQRKMSDYYFLRNKMLKCYQLR